MKRAGLILSVCSFMNIFLFGQSAQKSTLEHFGMQTFASNATEKKATIDKEEALSIYNLKDYEYVLEPEADKTYKEYQVIKLEGLSTQSVVIGLLTHSLKRESRFIEIGQYENLNVIREIIDNELDYVFVHPYERQYYITPEGEYKYIDGRELVGSRKVVQYLEKGKPITVTTFYFAMRDKGLIDRSVSLRTFISMSMEEKVKVLKLDIYASAKL